MRKKDLQNVLNILPFGIGYVKLLVNNSGEAKDYMFSDINPAFERLTGWRRTDVLRKRASEAPEVINLGGAYWITYFQSVVRSGKVQETTQWIDAFKRYLRIMAIPEDEISLVLLLRDASSASIRYRPNEVATPLPEDLEVIFNKTHDAISLVEYGDGEFHYIRNNAVHQALTGFNNIKGLTPAQLVGEEVGEKLRKYYEQCMRTGQPVSYEQKFSFAPGNRVWQTEVTPVFGKGGIRYLLCSSKDISELKKVQREHDVLTKRLYSMFYQHSAIMLIVEPGSGRILDANPAACKFYGYSKEELLNLLISDINMLPPNEVQRQRRAASEKREGYFLFPHRLKNGEIRLVDVCSCPIPDEEGDVLYSSECEGISFMQCLQYNNSSKTNLPGGG